MHNIHSIDNSSKFVRLFTGDDGDHRRLSPHHHDIKCPRCDSLNTKFCYYNNYNLSQPRHFCKNCRRYWTKGGILRNVPVGGGVRKTTKRSDKSKPKTNNVLKSSHSEHSNSDTSCLTTTTTTANTTNTQFFNFSESSNQLEKFELLKEGNNISKEVSDNIDMSDQLNNNRNEYEVQWIDRTPMYKADQCEDDDQGLFDLRGCVDDQSYWSQRQWNDNQLNYFP